MSSTNEREEQDGGQRGRPGRRSLQDRQGAVLELLQGKSTIDQIARRLGVRSETVAGWHTAKDLVVPEGLHLLFLPPYSPQLQPAERLWPLFREALANRSFADLGVLETVAQARCRWLQADQGYVRNPTHYN